MWIAKVRNFSRHDVIIVNGIRYDKNEWHDIEEGTKHEELVIIEKSTQKRLGKKDRGNYGNR